MKTVIEINGRKYDARTGKLLANEPSLASPKTEAKPVQAASRGTSIDGVNNHRKPTSPVAKATPMATVTPAPKPARAAQQSTQSIDIKPVRRPTQRSQTLLRTIVKKPQKTAPQIHATSTIAESQVEHSATGRGLLLKRVPDSRLARAKFTAKSMSINKFKVAGTGSKKPILRTDIGVSAAPKQHTPPEAAPALVKPKLGASATQKQVFQHSVAQATNHTHPKVKKQGFFKRSAQKISLNPRVLGAITAVFAALVLGGFLAYQNIPAVAMRVAASQAGFSGHMPNNPPAGFAFKGPVQSSKGSITIRYNSNSDSRSFAITQKPSDWTSDSLLANYVLSTKSRYQTYHDKGLTVFVYNNGDATWVDRGIWYSVQGQGTLSSDQILSIAGSM